MKTANIISILLLLCFLFSAFPIYADEPTESTELSSSEPEATEAEVIRETIAIHSVSEFLTFAENCRLDSFSKDLIVSLETDIDLTGHAFSGIPIFCGIFEGNGHTISGVTPDINGSVYGFFRYLTDTAMVSDLNISGTVQPKGTASVIGGIAGDNAGTIQNSTFSGTVSGIDHVGGIAGHNRPSGIIKDCAAKGTVYGNHFIGGIAGTNDGIIQRCTNSSQINTQVHQNEVNLSDITIDSITGSESAGTITDIGGIAGINNGSISKCENHADIGYPHIGYNIGGIAGSHTGYLTECTNTGVISGRKDVGGIAGQLEPALSITYATDTLQILRQQLNDLSGYVDIATKNAVNSATAIKNQLTLINDRLETAADALESLLPQYGEETPIPSLEEITAVIDILDSSISGVTSGLNKIYDNIEYADHTLTSDLQNISNAVSAMQQTLDSASDHLGGSVTDNSDADTDDDLTAKIAYSNNHGAVFGDLNTGGVVGTMAFENDLDPEADIEIFGDSTLNFSGAYRAVVTDCQNTADISVKRQYAGGIAGYVSIGLLRRCVSIADMDCPNAVYIGGIAGRSDGQIRNCSAKSQITAQDTAGGIAGLGNTVSDCMALVCVYGNEKTGMILGTAKDTTLLINNYYMQSAPEIGAVDGISYEGAAQGLPKEEFVKNPLLPEAFMTYTVSFQFHDGTTKDIVLNITDTFSQDDVPPLPSIDGCQGKWIGLEQISHYNATVSCVYETKQQVLQCADTRPSGLPILIAEGSFLPQTVLTIEKLQNIPVSDTVEAWHFTPHDSVRLRYLPPEGSNAKHLMVMERCADGNWKEIPHTTDGSYIVFTPSASCDAFCIVTVQHTPWALYIGLGAALVLIITITVAVIVKHKKTKTITPETEAAEP